MQVQFPHSQSLPDDVFLMILDCLHDGGGGGKATISAFSLVCKRFLHTSQRLLFRNIRVVSKPKDDTFERFLDFIKNPKHIHLSQYIKYLELEGFTELLVEIEDESADDDNQERGKDQEVRQADMDGDGEGEIQEHGEVETGREADDAQECTDDDEDQDSDSDIEGLNDLIRRRGELRNIERTEEDFDNARVALPFDIIAGIVEHVPEILRLDLSELTLIKSRTSSFVQPKPRVLLLERLCLEGVWVSTDYPDRRLEEFQRFVDVLGLFSCVRTFTLRGCMNTGYSSLLYSAEQAVSNLTYIPRDLQVNYFGVEQSDLTTIFIRLFQQTRSMTSLHTLSLLDISFLERDIVGEFIHQLGPRLISLRLDLRGIMCTIKRQGHTILPMDKLAKLHDGIATCASLEVLHISLLACGYDNDSDDDTTQISWQLLLSLLNHCAPLPKLAKLAISLFPPDDFTEVSFGKREGDELIWFPGSRKEIWEDCIQQLGWVELKESLRRLESLAYVNILMENRFGQVRGRLYTYFGEDMEAAIQEQLSGVEVVYSHSDYWAYA